MGEELKVGQVLYREVASRNAPTEIKEVVIRKIGNKYFYLEGWQDIYPINKSNLTYESKNYSQHNFTLYRTKQEILDKNEFANLREKLRKHFDWSGNSNKNTLEQLRQIIKILEL